MYTLLSSRMLAISLFAVIVVGYAALAIPMIDQIGIAFDEQTDLGIAQSYADEPLGWLRGSSEDPTNVRLPMYLSWLASGLDANPLYAARLLSVFMGVLTLLAVFLYCCTVFSPLTGVLASGIVAISPYFLSFSKIACTEGDSFITCMTAWLLLFVALLKKENSVKWVIGAGVCLGLALSAKASGAALVAATMVCLLLPRQSHPEHMLSAVELQPVLSGRVAMRVIALLTAVLLIIVGGYALSGPSSPDAIPTAYAQLSDDQLMLHYTLALLPWLLALGLLYRYRARSFAPGWPLLLVPALAATTFFLIPPVHVTNPYVITALVEIFLSSSSTFSWLFAWEAFTLHFLSILLKSGVVVGILLWLGVAAALFRCVRQPALRIPLLFFAAYFAFLTLKMPHAQTFYMMPLFPLAAIFLADWLLQIHKRSLPLFLLLLGSALCSTAWDLGRTYPYTHLNGYQWVGERYLGGRSTLGYRSVAQTPSDGLEQALEWLKQNVSPGERVLYFTYADHIVRPRLGGTGLVYLNGFHPIYTLDQANYVLIHINADINDGRGLDNPEGSIDIAYYDKEQLLKEFRKVHVQKRPFGLEAASVWYRKVPYAIDHTGNIYGFRTEEEGKLRHGSVD